MAELVQQRLEGFLPELEQLERVQLFSRDEVRAVVKKRQQFEYRLQRKHKSLVDFTRYIDYERSLLRLIWKRRERLGYRHKKAEIDLKISGRICQLFRIACVRFGTQQPDIFLSHVAFCRDMRQLAQASRVFTRLLRAHADKPHLWLSAASFELHDNNSADTARQLLLRAVRVHPASVALWCGYVRLELQYADILRQRHDLLGVQQESISRGGDECKQQTPESKSMDCDDKQEDDRSEGNVRSLTHQPCDIGDTSVDDPVLNGALAALVAREALRRIPEASEGRVCASSVVVSLLAVCAEFNFVSGLCSELLELLRRDHPGEPRTYDTLARAALQHSVDPVECGSEQEGTQHRIKLLHRLKRCCDIYDEALTTLFPTNVDCESLTDDDSNRVISPKVCQLYDLYLSTLCETLKQAPKHRRTIVSRLEDVFDRGHNLQALHETTYLECARSLVAGGCCDQAVEVLRAATRVYSQSAKLWTKLFDVCKQKLIYTEKEFPSDQSLVLTATDVDKLVSSAMVAVPDSAEGSCDMWRCFLQWTSRVSDSARPSQQGQHPSLTADDVWIATTGRSTAIVRAVKPLYLSSVADLSGLSAARAVFDRLHLIPPIDEDFYDVMLALETSALQNDAQGDAKRLRTVFTWALRHAGADNVRLWLNYWQFERHHGLALQAARVYEQAVKTLNPKASDQFVAEYTLIKNKVNVEKMSTD